MAKKDAAFAAWREEQSMEWKMMESKTLCEGLPFDIF